MLILCSVAGITPPFDTVSQAVAFSAVPVILAAGFVATLIPARSIWTPAFRRSRSHAIWRLN